MAKRENKTVTQLLTEIIEYHVKNHGESMKALRRIYEEAEKAGLAL